MPLPPHSAAMPLTPWLTAARMAEELLSASMLRIRFLRSMKLIFVMEPSSLGMSCSVSLAGRRPSSLGCVQLRLLLARRAVEPADDTRDQARLVVVARVRYKRVGVTSGASRGCDLRHGLSHDRRSRGVDQIRRRKIRQIVRRPAGPKRGRDVLRLCHDGGDGDIWK